MNAQELRIDNLIKYSETSSIFKVIGIHKFGLDVENDIETTYIEHDQFEPIPLTEQWLLDFGFENNYPIASREYKIKINGLSILMVNHYENGFLFMGVGWQVGIFIKHVHALQNLIYSLTGQELELNKK